MTYNFLRKLAIKAGIITEPDPSREEAKAAKEYSAEKRAEATVLKQEALSLVIALSQARRENHFRERWRAGLKGE